MRLRLTLLLLCCALPAYATDTALIDRDGVTQPLVLTPANIGAVSKSTIVSVTDYGAVPTTDATCWTGPDSTAAFESAQTALGATGGTVVVPNGQFCLSQLKIHDKVKIVGSGMVSTVLVPLPTTNNDFVVFNNNDVTFFGLYDLQLDGHYYDHSSGNGIMLARTNDGSISSPDKHGVIQRVRVQNFIGDGIKVTGACGAYNVIDVEYASNRVEYNRGAGFNLACTSDNFIHDNVSNSNQLEGFYVGSGAWANHYHNNKAFMNNKSASSTTAQWVFQGSVNNVLIDDEAQDSYQGGFIFNGISFMDITGIQVSGALPAGKLGVSVTSSSDLSMSGFTNVAAGSTLGNAVKINGCTSCSVDMDGAANDYTLTGTNTGTSFVWKNHIVTGQTAETPAGKFYKDDGTWGTPVSSVTCGAGKHVSAFDAATGTATCTDDTSTGGGTDPNAVHVSAAGEINAVTAKTAPVTSDILMIEDSASSWAKKKVTIGNLGIVQGPGSATNTGVARYDGTTGKLLKDSPLILDDTGNLYMPSGQKLMKNSSTDAAGISLDRSDPNLATSNNYSLLDLNHTFSNGTPNAGTNVYGINETISYGGTSTLGTVRGMMLSPRNAGGGTTDYIIGFSTWPRNTSGTVDGAIMGVEVQPPTNAGTITSGAYISGVYVGNQGLTGPGNTYGVKIADQSGGTNPYALYTGAGKILFGDKVGIGTTPSVNLDIQDVSGSAGQVNLWSNAGTTFSIRGFSSSATVRPVVSGNRGRGTIASPAAVQSGDKLGTFSFGGYDSAATPAPQQGAAIDFFANGTISSGNVPADISFATGTNSSTRTERLRITSGGMMAEGLTDYIASFTVANSTSSIVLASGTATVTLPKTLTAGSTSVLVTVSGAAASGVSFAAESGGSVSWGDAGAPTFTNSKSADAVCISENSSATTTAAWRCAKGGNF